MGAYSSTKDPKSSSTSTRKQFDYIKGGIPVPLRATSCDEPLPLICIELQKILGPEIFAAQAAGVDTLGTDKAAMLCHIIGIIDLAFAHNV